MGHEAGCVNLEYSPSMSGCFTKTAMHVAAQSSSSTAKYTARSQKFPESSACVAGPQIRGHIPRVKASGHVCWIVLPGQLHISHLAIMHQCSHRTRCCPAWVIQLQQSCLQAKVKLATLLAHDLLQCGAHTRDADNKSYTRTDRLWPADEVSVIVGCTTSRWQSSISEARG